MNKYNIVLIQLLFTLTVFCANSSNLQEIKFKSELKTSYLPEINDSIPWFFVHEPETKKPAFTHKGGGVYQYAYAGNIKKDFFKIAKKITANEKTTYYLRVTLENAREAGLICDEFVLPRSAVLIAEDLDGNLLTLQPYTHLDNLEKRYIKNTKKRAPGNVAGIYSLTYDFVLKLTINNNEIDSCKIHLEQFLYSFKENEQNIIKNKGVIETKSTDPCDFGVMCMSNYTNWVNEINSAVQIVLKYGVDVIYGSGVILNTTNNYNYDYSQHPFILTAAHLRDHYDSLGISIIDALRYSEIRPLEQSTCGSHNTPGLFYRGLQFLKEGNRAQLEDPKNDYMLLTSSFDLNDLISLGNISFAGWDATGLNNYSLPYRVPAYGFHHGEIIDNNGFVRRDNKYLILDRIYHNPTEDFFSYYNDNGIGWAVHGTSGAPVFDKDKRVIGLIAALSSATNTCEEPNNSQIFGPRFSFIWEDLKEFIGSEKIAYTFNPQYQNLPTHCTNCICDADKGEIEADCGGPCKPCGIWQDDYITINTNNQLAQLIKGQTVSVSEGVTLKSGKKSNIYASDGAYIAKSFKGESGSELYISHKGSPDIDMPCEDLCTPTIYHQICHSTGGWYAIAVNAVWVDVNVATPDGSIIYQNSFPNFTNDRILLWDFTGFVDNDPHPDSAQFIFQLRLKDCSGNIFELGYSDVRWLKVYHTC